MIATVVTAAVLVAIGWQLNAVRRARRALAAANRRVILEDRTAVAVRRGCRPQPVIRLVGGCPHCEHQRRVMRTWS